MPLDLTLIPENPESFETLGGSCKAHIKYGERRAGNETLLDFTLQHDHPKEEHLVLLGDVFLEIKTSEGIIQRKINFPKERSGELDYPKYEEKEPVDTIRLNPDTDYSNTRFVMKTRMDDCHVVEFSYMGEGKFKVYAQPRLETFSTWQTLSDLEQSRELVASPTKFQRCRMLVPRGGTHLQVRFQEDNDDKEYNILIYDVSVKNRVYQHKNVNP